MSDASPHVSKGQTAYQWFISGGMALVSALSWRVLTNVDDMAKKIESLQSQVTTLAAKMDWAERLNSSQDTKIDDLQKKVWGWQAPQQYQQPASRQPSPEQEQRKQWSQP